MREYRIAAIPGDGIGTEVIAAGLEALTALASRDGGFRLRVEHLPWGSDFHLEHGSATTAQVTRAVCERIRG